MSTRYEIDEASKRATTIFADGTRLDACPNYDEDSESRAATLGYTGDDPIWAMTRDHDRIHTLLAEARGLPHSPTLWAVAHGEPVDSTTADDEERIVLLIQRLLNQGLE